MIFDNIESQIENGYPSNQLATSNISRKLSFNQIKFTKTNQNPVRPSLQLIQLHLVQVPSSLIDYTLITKSF